MSRVAAVLCVFLTGCASSWLGGDPDGDGDGPGPDCTGRDCIPDECIPSDVDSPDPTGPIVFVSPYQAPALPEARDVQTTARVTRADVAILLDTTGSMAGTTARIQDHFQELVTLLAGAVDDLAFGAAGYGDFPINDGANSQYDVPFYIVHRIMTANTSAGLDSILSALQDRNIIVDGLGPWFAQMRGGDEPEQGWEALRQMATGVGISYPGAFGGTESVPAFDGASAYPATPPADEEVGTLGGLGFREDALPIIIQVTDTEHHDVPYPGTTPIAADAPAAVTALDAMSARVVGLMAWQVTGHDDLQFIAEQTHAVVSPDAWGTGSDRPANCPADRCCLVAEDPDTAAPEVQPLPVNGLCTLVFQGDRYDTGLADMIAQAVLAVTRGARFEVTASLVDAPGDEVDIHDLVERIEAVSEGPCGDLSASDANGDGVSETFDAVVAGSEVCFRIVPAQNDFIEQAELEQRFEGELQLEGDGLASMVSVPVTFIVPGVECATDECKVDDECASGEFCEGGRCLPIPQ